VTNDFFSEPNSPVDKILREEYFPDYSYKGTFVDVGAADPIEINDSWHFEMNGWDVLCIEPNPKYASKLRASRRKVVEAVVSNSTAEFLDFKVMTRDGSNAMSLSSIAPPQKYVEAHKTYHFDEETIRVKNVSLRKVIEEYFPEMTVDVLKIDVEGWELDVLRSLDLSKYKPRVLVVENLLHDPSYDEFICPFGYKKDKASSYNYFYRRET
jgi:FkbM family methyltransferase